MSLLYHLEFSIIPNQFNKGKAEFLSVLFNNKEAYFLNIFNDCYATIGKRNVFKEKDFSFIDCDMNEGQHIIYVGLPKPKMFDDPPVHCIAYFIAYQVHNDTITAIELYTAEVSKFGTNCIGSNVNGAHCNFGPLGKTLKESLDIVTKIAFS